jgi:hypothetical protein
MTLLLALILLILGFFSVGTTETATGATPVRPATAAAPRTNPDEPIADLTIRNLVCPADFTGANYAADCVDPVVGLDFELTGPLSDGSPVIAVATTDASGTVTFTDLPANTYEVSGGPPGEFVQNAITCYVTDLERLALPYLPRNNRAIGVTLVDTDITCDWYSIPENLRGDV